MVNETDISRGIPKIKYTIKHKIKLVEKINLAVNKVSEWFKLGIVFSTYCY